ncbi:hypothetical protein AHFPHNDE_02210 [Pseudomonas sp. MM227]|jgi:hypothetical protein|uniref:hypothetical protein n=1 Tax=unclassified Pseudomonas TaxID=196821 RepID=UPI000F02492A|nr:MULTISPECIES: hypothetical protein [unclassified Pseudomonas]RYE70717.1 MAG: hypothetical protein EOO81_07465 [Oxalobacteraceae bacterium]MBD8474939.1 hypothetical protein [Pseudomonas sp. CFBP 8773]MBD8595248.1 hypothetical protein [Pseudomonas sp. CFBP 8758]MBD8602599.1 hypothetical protein [Pseudomonas sp. CFBP 8771]MBD8624767.1 hypothetical protein [Pseudomonas sp. CFBP 13727]
MTDVELETTKQFMEWEDSSANYLDEQVRHEETLKNGCRIVVRARKIGEDKISVFFGTYGVDGRVIKEQTEIRDGLTCAKDALAFATDKAKRHAGGGAGAPDDNHHQATPV